jgi:nitroreductase
MNSISIIETINRRTSCRTYSDRPIEPEKAEALKTFLKENTASPFGCEVRFELLNFETPGMSETRTPGTYGVIKGAGHFIAGAVHQRWKSMEDFGYGMEKNILKATSLGLGTCWLGGTFNRSGFAEIMNLSGKELLPAVSPIGYPGGSRSLIDHFFRFCAGSGRRLAWRDLFFDGDFKHPLSKESAGLYETPLACVRVGPSASNLQPWRILKNNDRFHFYLRRTPRYKATFGPIKLQNIDMGIALCHFALSSEALGLNGRWQIYDPRIEAGDMEYIASWICGA